MIINRRNTVSLNTGVVNKVYTAVEGALQGITTSGEEFVVNDTTWFARNRKGSVTSCVVNSAQYMSKKFQYNLASYNGWKGETRLDRQNFDGFGLVQAEGAVYTLDEKVIVEFIKKYLLAINQPEYLISKYFSVFYGMYVKRNFFNLNGVPDELHGYFTNSSSSESIRIGVEFETGNIGSSFRALMKLNNLFLKGFIDVGVFITSNDKENCSARIWPSSNRNGSFAELENRNFRDNVHLPLIEIGFSPDRFSNNIGYLSERGGLYLPLATGSSIVHKSINYKVYLGDNNDEILLPEN
ncbi:hypothetical protein CWC16_09655 [Pseudoalteromonas sp. S3776]|uniref:hypothetical protein n=1 Tax=Pseudoalteromonas sp. S3776 TaxID=579544 RepID=UPI001109F018|nr:hypothetical protein [Pseudoalteromonas sp. S3776]TMO80054.1 hypothetical protein CWC16_09655 [Pseudoalteromonas sp. S3776]